MSNINAKAMVYELPNDNNLQRSTTAPWVILCDFDGTISLSDVTDTLLTTFGKSGHEDLENAWLNGEIGSRECMAGQIALLDMSKAELDVVLSCIELDPTFKIFVSKAKELGMPIKIVSDGLDYAIHHILKSYNLDYLPVYANRLVQIGERSWQLEFPHSTKNCIKASGNCKCARVAVYQQYNEQVLFVGDGSSDFCASEKVDFVLAKDKLITYCEQRSIPHLPITDFEQALTFITKTSYDFVAKA